MNENRNGIEASSRSLIHGRSQIGLSSSLLTESELSNRLYTRNESDLELRRSCDTLSDAAVHACVFETDLISSQVALSSSECSLGEGTSSVDCLETSKHDWAYKLYSSEACKSDISNDEASKSYSFDACRPDTSDESKAYSSEDFKPNSITNQLIDVNKDKSSVEDRSLETLQSSWEREDNQVCASRQSLQISESIRNGNVERVQRLQSKRLRMTIMRS